MSWFFCFLIFGILGRGLGIKPCPSKCICEKGTVDCSGLGLTEVPRHIPKTAQSLWVSTISRSRAAKDTEFKLFSILIMFTQRNCEASQFFFMNSVSSRCRIEFSAPCTNLNSSSSAVSVAAFPACMNVIA